MSHPRITREQREVIAGLWRTHPDWPVIEVAALAERQLGRELSYKTAHACKPPGLKSPCRQTRTGGAG